MRELGLTSLAQDTQNTVRRNLHLIKYPMLNRYETVILQEMYCFVFAVFPVSLHGD